jgi:hypothetical protein
MDPRGPDRGVRDPTGAAARGRRYRQTMTPLWVRASTAASLATAGAIVASLAAAGALTAVVGASAHVPAQPSARVPLSAHVPRRPSAQSPEQALLQSRELWATVNACNPPEHPRTIGVRGSMPGDGHPRDVMYMRFLVQDLDQSTNTWVDVGASADSGFVRIGSAASTRQAGRTFEFKPTATPYTLRGMVEFQWRRAGHAVHSASRPTTAEHVSLAGAEPKGFSAAACVLT